MNHPLWPVVRESARRVVRIEKISITAPDEYASDIIHLSGLIGDHIPQRSTFPVHRKAKKKKFGYMMIQGCNHLNNLHWKYRAPN